VFAVQIAVSFVLLLFLVTVMVETCDGLLGRQSRRDVPPPVDSLTRALAASGFRCTRKQTPFIMQKMTAADYVVIVGSAMAAVGAIVLRAKGFGEVIPRL